MARKKKYSSNKASSFYAEKIEGFGFLTRDPQIISSENAQTVVVAINVGVNSQNHNSVTNKTVERSDFRNIKLFGRDAKLAYMNLRKGDRVHFAGKCYPTEYTDRDGDIVEDFEITADMGEVYPAPLWEERDVRKFDNFDIEEEGDSGNPSYDVPPTPLNSPSRGGTRKTKAKPARSRNNIRDEFDQAEGAPGIDEEELPDENDDDSDSAPLDDSFANDPAPTNTRRKRRAAPGTAKRKKPSGGKSQRVTVENDDYDVDI